MNFSKVVIDSYATYLPEQYLTSDQIETQLETTYQRLKLPKGRLELMSGIKQRGYWPIGTKPSDLSSKAAELALSKSEISRDKIDLLIHASVCRDFLEPATAAIVHNNLGLSSDCLFFDLSNACLGFINAVLLAAQQIETNQIRAALIVSGENAGPLLLNTIKELQTNLLIDRQSIKKYFANLTIGSGAVAYVITSSDLSQSKIKINTSFTQTDSKASVLCHGGGDINSLTMETDSEQLMQKGITLALKTWKPFRNSFAPDCVIMHQVGTAHEKLLLESLEVKNLKTHITYPHLGNTGSAALPITFCEYLNDKNNSESHNIGLLGIGSGLSCTMVGVSL